MIIVPYIFLMFYAFINVFFYCGVYKEITDLTICKYGHQTIKGVGHFFVYIYNLCEGVYKNKAVSVLFTIEFCLILFLCIPIHFFKLLICQIIYYKNKEKQK